MLERWVFTASWTGRRGERLTERELNLVDLFGRKGKVLKNLYVPVVDGKTSEIDLIYITQKGIFVLESKNYTGWIFGDEDQPYWTAMLPNKQKNRFYNPILQNKTHIKRLQEYLSADNVSVPMFSLVVFSERCELKKVTVSSGMSRVVKRDRLYAAVRKIWDASPDVLSPDEVEVLYNRLLPLTQADNALKKQHVQNIQKRYKPSSVSPSVSAEEHRCPRCGQKLVLRTAKKGAHAGESFYGCSGYPNCRYTKSLEE